MENWLTLRNFSFRCIRLRIALLLALILSGGTSATKAQIRDTDIRRSVNVDGQTRTYILHIPSNHPAQSPLVLVLHGGGGKAESMRGITGMDRVSDQHGFIAAYPQGLGLVWDDGGSDLVDDKQPRDDIAFIRKLIDDVNAQAPVDRKRVFACGLSNGGSMCSRLALEAHDIIAGAAMVGSGLYVKQVQKFPNPAPISIMIIEGTDDPCFPYKGGETTAPNFGAMFNDAHHGTVLSTDDAAAFWCKANGWKGNKLTGTVPHITKDETSTSWERYAAPNGNVVAVMVVKGGGHCWPGGIQYFPVKVIGKTTYDFSASQVIWQFFSKIGGG